MKKGEFALTPRSLPAHEAPLILPAVEIQSGHSKWRTRTEQCRMKSCVPCLAILMSTILPTSGADSIRPDPARAIEKQITSGPGGRILTNTGVWSPDGKWIVYDTRPDAAGDVFEGPRIEMVNVETGEVRRLYESRSGAYCGVATFNPIADRVAFILGPENPTPDWQYGASRRQGAIVDVSKPRLAARLDARDLTSPFTPGALRGGSHVHVWAARGDWLGFTYNDALVESDIRDVGVSVPARPVQVKHDHPRNHDGNFFSVIVTKTLANPGPGSDEIKRACEEGWIGTEGYTRNDGSRQRRALAFQGQVVTAKGETISEVFMADLPDDLTHPGSGPLEGTEGHRPFPPKGVSQRRLTFTSDRKHPGLQGPRHWLRSSPDGSHIAFLMKDEAGVAQIWTVSPNGGPPTQLTRNSSPIASAFTWSRDGRYIAHALDNAVAVTDAKTGATTRLTPRSTDAMAPRPEACVFSPDGGRIAYVRRTQTDGADHNQIFVLTLKP
jgi:hypothetical protein